MIFLSLNTLQMRVYVCVKIILFVFPKHLECQGLIKEVFLFFFRYVHSLCVCLHTTKNSGKLVNQRQFCMGHIFANPESKALTALLFNVSFQRCLCN